MGGREERWVGNGFGLHRIYSSALAALLNAGPYGFKDSSTELLEKNLLTRAATNILLELQLILCIKLKLFLKNEVFSIKTRNLNGSEFCTVAHWSFNTRDQLCCLI